MQIELWLIQGESFHFGRHGLGQEETAISMSSDSLFAALVARLAEIGGQIAVEQFMAPFLAGAPPFVLSSAFPLAGQVRFFPLPGHALQTRLSTGEDHLKDLKKVKYLSENLFRNVIAGESLLQHFPEAVKLQGQHILISPDEIQFLPEDMRQVDAQIWAIEQRPRVTLGRGAQQASLFHTGRVSYAPKSGLWFGLRWFVEDAQLKSTLASLMVDLGDAGLGGERSVGFGACRIELAGEITLPGAQGKPWVSLSRYLPRQDEMQALLDAGAFYSLERVGGWLDSPVQRGQRRRSINMIVEGSVLGPLDHPAPGQILDVRPSYPTDPDPLGHAVYRSGMALAVGLEGAAS